MSAETTTVELGSIGRMEAQALRRALRDVDAACEGFIRSRNATPAERELAQQEQEVANLLLQRLPAPPPLEPELQAIVDAVTR